MFASVTGVSIAVLAVVTPPAIANVAPPPPPLLTGALAVGMSSSSTGSIIGVIVGVIIALVLALVFMRRRRHHNKKRRKNGGLQVPNGREAQLDEKGAPARKTKAESADEMSAPEPKPKGATKAPETLKLELATEEGFELQNTSPQNTPLQNTPLVSSFLGMFSPKPEGVQNV
jgi:H+/gluconate symporter-like permease